MTDISNENVMEAFEELKTQVKSGLPDPEVMTRVGALLDAQEDINQAKVKESNRIDNELKDITENYDKVVEELASYKGSPKGEEFKALSERADALELLLAKGGVGTADAGDIETQIANDPDCKAFEAFAVHGADSDEFQLAKKQMLRTDINPQGGYLVPKLMDNVIRKKIVEVSNVRGVARVRTISGKTIEIPIRDQIPTALFEGEAEQGPTSATIYESAQVTPFRQTTMIPITQDMMMDAAFNMQAEITDDVALAFAKGEGTANVNGTGIKQPSGFMVDPRVIANFQASALASVLGPDDLMKITGQLKTGYNPVYAMNRKTFAGVRSQVGANGQFVWSPALDGPAMNTLAGYPYVILEDMPDVAVGQTPVVFADFQRGYEIFDREGMNLIRDIYTGAQAAIVKWTFFRYTTGQVIIPEAFTGITITSP